MSLDVFITLTLLFALATIGVWVGVYQNRQHLAILNAQAEKRGGEVVRNNIFSRAELHLPFKGITIKVFALPGNRYSPPRMLATVRSDSALFPAINVLRNTPMQKLLGSFGRERILTGDEEFDKRCVVRADDSYTVQRLLTPTVRLCFLDPFLRSLELKASPQSIQIQIYSYSKDDEAYDHFIEAALTILQGIL